MVLNEEKTNDKCKINFSNNNEINISTTDKTSNFNNEISEDTEINDNSCEEENIKRNKIILDLLHKNKIDQDKQNDTLDQKCSSMINILILIITIQCGIFVNVDLFKSLDTSELTIIVKVLLILTLIGNFISLFSFINAYSLKNFQGLTREDKLIEYGEKKKI